MNAIFNMFMKNLREKKEASFNGKDGTVTISIREGVKIEEEHLMNESIDVLLKKHPKEVIYKDDKKQDKAHINMFKEMLRGLMVVTLDFKGKDGSSEHDEVIIYPEELEGKIYNNFFKDRVVYMGKNEPKKKDEPKL